MQEHYLHWFKQIENLRGAANVEHIDIVVDQAGWDRSILPALRQMEPSISWFSLFSGSPEEAMLTQAPILMRIDFREWRHKAWLEELVEQAGGLHRLMLLISPMPFEALAESLQRLSQIEWGGQTGLLRFYDPRVMPALLASVLSLEQKEYFLRAALFWTWLDRDQQPVWYQGSYRSNRSSVEAPSAIALTDSQFDLLGSISDAQSLLGVAMDRLPGWSAEQCFSRCYCVVLKASREGYFGNLSRYLELDLEDCGHSEK